MKNSTTAERLKLIMKERNLKQVDILRACEPYCEKYGVKLRKNDLSQYISGKTEPKQDKLSLLSMALKVSEVWLMGYDVEPIANFSERPDIEQQIERTYGSATLSALLLYERLDSDDQGEIRGEMRQMLKADKYL